MQEQVIARAAEGETFTHAQIKEMIERATHTSFYVGPALVEGDKARSKTEREAKRRKNDTKNDTCDPNHWDHSPPKSDDGLRSIGAAVVVVWLNAKIIVTRLSTFTAGANLTSR
jgi:hypothetical protein